MDTSTNVALDWETDYCEEKKLCWKKKYQILKTQKLMQFVADEHREKFEVTLFRKRCLDYTKQA